MVLRARLARPSIKKQLKQRDEYSEDTEDGWLTLNTAAGRRTFLDDPLPVDDELAAGLDGQTSWTKFLSPLRTDSANREPAEAVDQGTSTVDG